eukprot:6179842-Pleurochrysis_carterae.AAC.11
MHARAMRRRVLWREKRRCASSRWRYSRAASSAKDSVLNAHSETLRGGPTVVIASLEKGGALQPAVPSHSVREKAAPYCKTTQRLVQGDAASLHPLRPRAASAIAAGRRGRDRCSGGAALPPPCHSLFDSG